VKEDRTMAETVSPAAAGLGLGIALASAPGPVQAVLLSESIRGGVARGFRAMAGASVTFGFLLVALALGVSVAAPSGALLRVLEIAGGALLVVLAVDGFRARPRLEQANGKRRELPPVARGSLAVLLNPGAWLFLGTAASSLFAAATQEGGTDAALLAALALVIGLAAGDGVVVLLGGLGVRRAGERVGLWVRRGLAVILAALGVALIVRGVVS
jgi:threonine/homoserine/homoserine lactone efflux protein